MYYVHVPGSHAVECLGLKPAFWTLRVDEFAISDLHAQPCYSKRAAWQRPVQEMFDGDVEFGLGF